MSRVLHLTHTDIRFDSRIIKQITALRSAGLNVDGIGIDFTEGKSEEESCIQNVKTICVRSNSLRKYRYFPKVIAHVILVLELTFKFLFASLKARPDVIHCHDILVLPVGVILKALLGSKLIYDAHELESNKNGLSPFLGKLTFRIEKILWSRIDGFITVSNSILEWYKANFNCVDKKVEVILNAPVVLNDLKLDKDYLRQKFSIPANAKLFIYVGIFAPGRFIDELISVFNDPLVSSHVVFLGYGPLLDKVQSAEKKSEKIHVHKSVSHDRVVSIVSGADYGVCLIPNVSLSDFFSLPNKFFEYIFSGVPVLASRMPEIESLVKAHNLGECCDSDAKSVLKKIIDIESSQLELNTPKFEEIKYLGWQNQVDKLINFYDSLT